MPSPTMSVVRPAQNAAIGRFLLEVFSVRLPSPKEQPLPFQDILHGGLYPKACS